LRKLNAAKSTGEFAVNGFAFVSMPACGWMTADAQPWRRPDPVAIGAAFVALEALA
jgi:hypothetical protein